MKIYILFLFCLFVGINLSAQHILFDWQNCIKGGKYNTTGATICAVTNGYLVAAIQERVSHVDIVLLKTSLTGDSLWSKYYGGSDDDWLCCILPTLDGNYYLVGTAASLDGDIAYNPYPGLPNIWVVKIDSSGNKLWDRVFGGTNKDEAMNAIVTNDGGLAVLGSTFSYDGDITNYYGAMDVWLLKLDNNGNKQWDFTVGTPGFDYAYGITQTQDSGYIFGGGFKEGSVGNIQCYNADSNYLDAFVFHLDKHGEPIGKKCYSGMHDDFMRQIIELQDGYLIAGNTSSPDISPDEIGFHSGYNHTGYPTTDIWLQKTDFEWNIEWERCYGGSGWDDMYRIYQCVDGDYMMFGTTNSNDGDVNGIHGYEPGYPTKDDIWMVRLNSLGEIKWQRCIGKLAAERLQMNSILKLDEAHYILSVEAEGCIMDDDFTCTTTDDPYHCYNYAWVIQINDTAASVGITEQLTSLNIKLYPNPAADYIVLEIPQEFDMKQTIAEITDISGRKMQSVVLSGYKPYLYTGDLPAGLYLLRLINKEGFVSKRFVKRDM